MASAAPVNLERVVSQKSESCQVAPTVRQRFITWLNLWCSSFIGEVLWITARW